MKTLLVRISILFIVLSMLPATSFAIPAFAKKYGTNCNMCHTGYARLNDFGQRFRDNGYQIPGQEGAEKTIFDLAPPLALRTTTGLTGYTTKEGTASGFNLFGLDLLAGGVLHKDISFLLIYTPRLDEPTADVTGATGNNPSQLATLESASLIFSNVVQDVVNIRVGKFEPAYHPFSSKRLHTLFQPYEVYNFTTPVNTFVFNDNQLGIEATGHLRNGFKYGVGVVNGNGGGPDHNKEKDLYVNLSQTFGKGDGQSAGQRIGGFTYYGWQPLTTPGNVTAPTGETNGMDNKPFYRAGLDGSFNYETFNLGVLLMTGVDDQAFNTLNSQEQYKFTGGVAELNWAGLMNNRLVASLMYNWVRPPSYDSGRQINAYSVLGRYYIGDWSAVNIALHAEYTFRQIGRDNPLNEHHYSLLMDFAF